MNNKLPFSVLLQLSARRWKRGLKALRGACEDLSPQFILHVSLSGAATELVTEIRSMVDQGRIETFIHTRKRVDFGFELRSLLELVRTDYVLCLSDQVVLQPCWRQSIEAALEGAREDMDVAGKLCRLNRDKAYLEALQSQPWFRGLDSLETNLGPFLKQLGLDPADAATTSIYPAGSCFLARTAFLRTHDFPANGRGWHDAFLGDLIWQAGGRLKALATENFARAEGKSRDSELTVSIPEPFVAKAAVKRVEAGRRQTVPREDDFIQLNDSGNQLCAQHKYFEASGMYRRAIALAPDRPELQYNLGNTLKALGRAAEAVGCYQRAIELKPDYAEALNNLGIALVSLNRGKEAVEAYKKAVTSNPRSAATHHNLGYALETIGEADQAIHAYTSAIERDFTLAPAHFNLARLFSAKGDDIRSLLHLRIALHHRPEMQEARRSEAELLLRQGEPAIGLQDYAPPLPQAIHPSPAALKGKTLLIRQAVGERETILFSRYLRCLAGLGTDTIVECQPAFVRLLSKIEDVEAVAEVPASIRFDLDVRLDQLPLLLGQPRPDAGGFPYLTAPRHLPTPLKPTPQRTLRVGISWGGEQPAGPGSDPLTLRHFESLYTMPGLALFSLQLNPAQEELTELAAHPLIQDLGSASRDLADCSAFIRQLDLVIGSDASASHLAAALGKPVWVIEPPANGWMWGREGDSTAWYPSAKIFRRRAGHDLQSIFKEVLDGLESLIEQRLADLIPSCADSSS